MHELVGDKLKNMEMDLAVKRYPVIIVGAGQAGLAAEY